LKNPTALDSPLAGWSAAGLESDMSEDYDDSGELSTAEEIPLDFRLKNLVELSNFPSAKLEELVRVRNVWPCETCLAPVARVRLGHEVRTVDCFRDALHSREFAPGWEANVLSEHVCAGCCQ
jgi:hypothetical protein